MFVWARLPAPVRADGSLAFAERLLCEAHVAVSPGIGFTGPSSLGADQDDGDRRTAAPVDESRRRRAGSADEFVRFALVQPEDRLREACGRIGHVLKGRSG
jgi:alanine-synthesizing transaminase